MFKMLSTSVKLVPVILLVAGVAYTYHTHIVNKQKSEINGLQSQVDQLYSDNVTLRSAAEINRNTITRLNESITAQNNRISTLTNNNNQLIRERDQYLSIFRRHDLTRLSLARPGLIENRINSGTADVFRTLELDTLGEDNNETQ